MSAATRVQLARATLAASALAGTALTWFAVAGLHPVYGAMAATLVAVALLWMLRHVFSRRRVVLWLEERVPALRWSLASLEDAPASAFRPQLERMVHDARFGVPLARATVLLVGVPLALLFLSQLALRPLVESMVAARAAGPSATPTRDAAGGGSRRGRLVAIVTAPSYMEGRPERLTDPGAITAYIGSALRFSGDWSGAMTMPARPVVHRLEGSAGTRMVALEPRLDSTPRVVLELPVRDSVLASTTGRLGLRAQARDDIGLVDGWFEVIISSGSGESFVFRTLTLGRADARRSRALQLTATLPLDSLQLRPGDVMHLRAVARDANPSGEIGSSETRTLRVPRPGENDSLSITPAPPPEVGRSEVSQRMLIILTERLVARMPRLARDDVQRESGAIARDQARLRKRVGEIIFSRLTGEEHDDEEVQDALADTVSPAEALLRAASEATNIETEHEHGDEGLVVGVNRPLLEAFNAMWEAERHLGVGAPRQALPHMRAALDAIQRARAAERLYLRGRAPRIVIDLDRVRLQGKRDEMAPAARSPRASALQEVLARRARFQSALALMSADSTVAAAIDSLMVLRIDVLAEQPSLAVALSEAIEALRSGRDATEPLRVARRELNGAPVRGREMRWGGAW